MILNGPKVEPTGNPESAIILLHGYGANGDDLIDLAAFWKTRFPTTVFLSPNAPEEIPFLGFGGLQWFGLATRSAEEFWSGVNHAAPVLNTYIDEVISHYSLSARQVALVGFSQGTMMALHVGLRRSESLAAIVGLSGRLAGPEHLSTELKSRPAVQLIHGEDDDVIDVDAIHVAREALTRVGIGVEWHIRPGLGHGIDEQGLQLAGDFLAEHMPRG